MLPKSRTGAYGGVRPISYLFSTGRIGYGWQTYAWSGGAWDGRAKLEQYIEHRLERERKVLAAIESGARGPDEILPIAWDDAPIDSVPILRQAAAAALEAHLEKLGDEGRLPD